MKDLAGQEMAWGSLGPQPHQSSGNADGIHCLSAMHYRVGCRPELPLSELGKERPGALGTRPSGARPFY